MRPAYAEFAVPGGCTAVPHLGPAVLAAAEQSHPPTLPPGRLEGQQRHGPLVRAVHLGVEGELLAAQLKVPKLEGDPGDGGPAGLQGGQVQPALGHSDTLHLRVGGRHVPLLGRVVLLRDVNAVGLFRFGMEDL